MSFIAIPTVSCYQVGKLVRYSSLARDHWAVPGGAKCASTRDNSSAEWGRADLGTRLLPGRQDKAFSTTACFSRCLVVNPSGRRSDDPLSIIPEEQEMPQRTVSCLLPAPRLQSLAVANPWHQRYLRLTTLAPHAGHEVMNLTHLSPWWGFGAQGCLHSQFSPPIC